MAHHGHAPSRAEAVRALLLKAAGAHGVGTAHDLADYYRLSISEARAGLEELVRQRQLELVSVEGWRGGLFAPVGGAASLREGLQFAFAV